MHKPQDLLEIMLTTGYHIVQENGQRRFGPPPNWQGPPPPRGSEIFIGNIPRNCFEKDILPIFQPIGKIYEFRLMMDFSGFHRGFAFLMFTSPSEAQRAIKLCDNYRMPNGRRIGVMRSYENNRLCIYNIPKERTKEEIKEQMEYFTSDIIDVAVESSGENKNSGFALVEYSNHRAAAIARRKLVPGNLVLWGQIVTIDWADPVNKPFQPSKDSILVVKNLPSKYDEKQIYHIFSLEGKLDVKKVERKNSLFLIYYKKKSDAEEALIFHNSSVGFFSNNNSRVIINQVKSHRTLTSLNSNWVNPTSVNPASVNPTSVYPINKAASNCVKPYDNLNNLNLGFKCLNISNVSKKISNSANPTSNGPLSIYSPLNYHPNQYPTQVINTQATHIL